MKHADLLFEEWIEIRNEIEEHKRHRDQHQEYIDYQYKVLPNKAYSLEVYESEKKRYAELIETSYIKLDEDHTALQPKRERFKILTENLLRSGKYGYAVFDYELSKKKLDLTHKIQAYEEALKNEDNIRLLEYRKEALEEAYKELDKLKDESQLLAFNKRIFNTNYSLEQRIEVISKCHPNFDIFENTEKMQRLIVNGQTYDQARFSILRDNFGYGSLSKDEFDHCLQTSLIQKLQNAAEDEKFNEVRNLFSRPRLIEYIVESGILTENSEQANLLSGELKQILTQKNPKLRPSNVLLDYLDDTSSLRTQEHQERLKDIIFKRLNAGKARNSEFSQPREERIKAHPEFKENLCFGRAFIKDVIDSEKHLTTRARKKLLEDQMLNNTQESTNTKNYLQQVMEDAFMEAETYAQRRQHPQL